MKPVLAVAAHPDDETLGCGGTLLRHRSNGDEIFWMIVSTLTPDAGFTPSQIEARGRQIEKVAQDYDFKDVFQLENPTTTLDTLPLRVLVSQISKVVHIVKPRVVYLPCGQDVHSDHRVVFRAAFSSLKSFRAPFVQRTLMMETLSETEFAPPVVCGGFCPNVFIDISSFMEKKLMIMRRYAGEVTEPPSPRSVETIKALATFRGATCGHRYAEAFMLLKEVL